MRQFQKVLFALAAVVVLSLAAAGSAFAQGASVWSVSSDDRDARAQSVADAIGVLTLGATSQGTINVGSKIIIEYNTDIIHGVDNDDDGDDLDAVTGVTFVTNPADGSPAGTIDCDAGDLDVDVDDNVVTLEFTDTCEIQVGDTIELRGLRADTHAIGEGNDVTADVDAVVPAGAPSVTFLGGLVVVANVKDTLEIDIDSGGNLLTCKENEQVTIVKMEEIFRQALSSLDEEIAYADYEEDGDTDVERGMKIKITFKNVPEDVTIKLINPLDGDELEGITDEDAEFDIAGEELDVDPFVTIDAGETEFTSDGDEDIEFTFTIEDTDETDIEKIEVAFLISTADPIAAVGAGVTIDLEVELEAGDIDDDEVPSFEDAVTEGTGFTIGDCLSILLFSWVANTGDGAFDTGFAVANPSSDPPVIGTEGQTGKVTMYFFRNTGTSNPPAVVMSSSLAPGATTTGVLSSMVSGAFRGYAIAICEFQYGHGVWFMNAPQPGTGGASWQGWSALSLTNPRDAAFAGGTTESSGQ